ncbi:hypothetical protein [Paraglaciecola psychrophila]|uniref:O-antigen polymerase n=1 Tax=Paraglaciecola psychrophila 170 TaxID=1129794 RepID=K6ZSG3_9ALTE|nr:hypothetical protein [Paraglaciecola psychrophila]AGH43158.1 hypothetical protein C427_1049 [Paraglaciecola psychrophila 170]GAC38836.1 hypothetical protein GPSY_3225 [Paraglaciecola psychrophila 170]
MYRTERFFVYLYILPFSLDFKGAEDGGSVIQFFFLATVLFAGIVLIASFSKIPAIKSIPHKLKIIHNIWWFYLASSILTALINQVPIGNYVRVMLPYFLSGFSMLIVIMIYSRGRDLNIFFAPILWALWTSVCWTAVYAVAFLNIPLNEMRYQIVSPLLVVFLAYGIVLLLTQKKISKMAMAIGLTCIVIIVISVTRSLLLSAAFILFFIFVVYPQSQRRPLIKKAVRLFMPLAILMVIAIPLIMVFRPDAFTAWQLRLFSQQEDLGFDVTTVTRLAEYSGQMKMLFENFTSAFFGRGMGSVYYWDPLYYDQISQVIDITKLEESVRWSNGHSLWVYSIYSGGLLFGWLIPFCVLSAAYITYKDIKNNISDINERHKSRVLFFYVIGIAILSATFTANPLGVRLVGMFYGLAITLPILYLKQVKELQIIGRVK